MPIPSCWKCPGCGASVALPGRGETDGCATARVDERRLDQLAQAVCGCWVRRLSTGELTRLVVAVMSEDGR